MKPESDLERPIADLSGLPIRFVLGRHEDRDFAREGADVVVRNPGVRRNSRYLQLARDSGVRIEMEMSLFLRACPAPVIGITGTKGKTTTSSLCGEILRQWNSRTLLAGNMGVSAVSELERLDRETPVVLELSSWQLEALDEHKLAPRIAVLTNISQDHLDAYDGFDDYAATKRSIARHLTADGYLVVNRDDPEAWKAADTTRGRIVPFGCGERAENGAWVEDRSVIWRFDDLLERFSLPERLPFVGEHQFLNAAAAIAAASLRGAPPEAIRAGIEAFTGVRNRMETVAEIDGVTYINDSAATAPIAAIANLTGLASRRVHVISGGHDKQSDLSELASTLAGLAASIHLLDGTATANLRSLIERAGASPAGPFDAMETAVRSAATQARAGDIVLLSPGVASFGLFRDEFDRGDQFRASVLALNVAGAATA
jgi:UDP-N-acetylmuramoylalanine--D-glutamate ligase